MIVVNSSASFQRAAATRARRSLLPLICASSYQAVRQSGGRYTADMPFPLSTRPLTQEEINGLRVNTIMPVVIIAGIAFVAVLMTLFIVVPMWKAPLVKWFVAAVAILLTTMAVF